VLSPLCHHSQEDKMKSIHSYDRYQRQLILKGFGQDAQDKLANASVLVIGAGGLGCPLLQYLVAAGIGHIGIADDDVVSLSNLHRQVLFTMEDIGKSKVEVAKKRLQLMNDSVKISIWNERWTQQHSVDHFNDYDLIVDATDNFSSRYLINDAAVLMEKTLVFGAVSQYEGQVAVFNYPMADSRSVNYRDYFPEPPKNGEVLNCSEAGVLGVLPGIIGTMQATEVIKILTGIGNPLINRILTYNALSHESYIMELERKSILNGAPGSVKDFLNTNYDEMCGISYFDIDELDVHEWNVQQHNFLLVDIREVHELPKLNALAHLTIPLSELHNRLNELSDSNVLFVCQSGRRSLQAAMMIKNEVESSKAYSLKGGVEELLKQKII
jgi:molybdopterin/thiamine biosynthesis adenylyltransferase/rhodanese-related sulfurtransferase